MKPKLANRRPEPRNVFVLSGGGARGAAQVGMMTALLAAGIRPHALVGTSVGALNAAFVAADPTLEHVLDLAQRWGQLRTRDIFGGSAWSKVNHLLHRHSHLYDADGLAEIVASWCPYRRLEDLPTPVRVVTTHLGTGRASYHDTGDLTRVLLASAALPALFAPVELPDPDTGALASHVDGGISDLVPLAGAVSLSPTHVYVLDVTVPAVLERPRSPLDVLVASLNVSMRLRGDVTFAPGVKVCHIHTEDFAVRGGLMDFTRTDPLIAAGAATAREVLAQPQPLTEAGLLRERWPRRRGARHTSRLAGVPTLAGLPTVS